MADYDKAAYAQFERDVIAKYTPGWWNNGEVDTANTAPPPNTSTTPTDGSPSYVIKAGKKVVCADFYLPDNEARTIWERSNDPVTCCQMQAKLKKCKLNLHHAGNARKATTEAEAMGKVTFGWDAPDSVLKLPATDSGGLTNVKLEFTNGAMAFNTLVTNASATIYDAAAAAPTVTVDSTEAEIIRASAATLAVWVDGNQMLAGKDQETLAANLTKWVTSIQTNYLRGNDLGIVSLKLRVATFPAENRVVVTRKQVFDELGRYMTRTWSDDAAKYATTPEEDAAAPLFMGVVPYTIKVPDGFITPNINLENIENEYAPLF